MKKTLNFGITINSRRLRPNLMLGGVNDMQHIQYFNNYPYPL